MAGERVKDYKTGDERTPRLQKKTKQERGEATRKRE